jgi:hypothetical protein
MPLQWTMKAFVYAVFIDTPEYKGAMPCTPGTMIPIGNASTTSNFAWCASYKGRSTGFYCVRTPMPNPTRARCSIAIAAVLAPPCVQRDT